jgi:AcrR family transcriptional regulator
MPDKQTSADAHRGARRKPRADGLEARARVLDSAESLFAQRGFHGTSVRDITEQAGVRLASVNYHFVSKETLFRDVLLRRAELLCQDRLGLLERAPRSGSRAQRTRALVHAFVAPVAARAAEGAGWRNYLALIAQVANSRLEALALVAGPFNAAALRFIERLVQIHPSCPRRVLNHHYQFMLAATLYAFSGNQRLESLTAGAQRSDDYASVERQLVEFVSLAIVHACQAEARKKAGVKLRALRPRAPSRNRG